MSHVRLKIEPQGEPPLFLELVAGRYLLGRGEECEVRIDHDGVSRRHALLVVDQGGVTVEDLHSSNGTDIDGDRVEATTAFQPGQILTLGTDAIRVQFAEEPEAVPAAARFKNRDGEPVGPELFHSNYVFQTEIARGGMGTVLEAKDLNTGRTVAVKKMLAGLEATAEAQFRFQQEARVMGWLEHANIVPMHELGVNENGVPYYTMKRVRGVTLQTLLRGIRDGDAERIAQYPLVRLLEVFLKVCDGVAFAHSRGVVHRDLKPENVLVGAFGEVMLLDWGLAKVLPGSPLRNSVVGRIPDILDVGDLSEEMGEDSSRSGLFRTREGAVIGTPNYMPPEQAEGRIAEVDIRSDVFSLGGILYSILTLRPPVTGRDVHEVLANMRDGYIPPPVIYNKVKSSRLPGSGTDDGRVIVLRHCPGGLIPEALSRVAMQAMAKRQDDRYQDVRELQAEVESWMNGRATRAEGAGPGRQLMLLIARHRRTALAALVVLLCGAFFLVQSVREERKLQAALLELRKGVPLIEADVKGLVTAGEFERALSRLETLLVFMPDAADYQLQRAELLQTLTRFDEAGRAYEAAVDAGADPGLAAAEIAVCRELQALRGSEGLSREGYERLIAHLQERKRFAEAKRLALVQGLDSAVEKPDVSLAAFRSLLREQGAAEEILAGVKLSAEGRLSLDLRGRKVDDISTVTGLPFEVVNLAGTGVVDLRPLRGMPLQQLNLSGSPVVDLEPLQGMPLRDVNLAGTSVASLDRLTTARLERLDLTGTKVTELDPLRDDPLTSLIISRTGIADLTPVAAAKIERFEATRCGRLQNVDALVGMPLADLDLSFTAVTNLAPLGKAKVRRVNLTGIPATDFSALRNWRLNVAWLHDTRLEDLSVFSEMALEELHAARIPARDFAVLAKLPLKRVTLSGTAIVDLAPLGAKTLEHLDLSFTRITDLRPLATASVDSLMLHGCNGIVNWDPLRKIGGLRRVSIPAATVPKQALRNARSIAQMNAADIARTRGDVWINDAQIEAFWKKYGRTSTSGK